MTTEQQEITNTEPAPELQTEAKQTVEESQPAATLPQEGPSPENKFVKLFTPQERSAVAALKKKLPEILKATAEKENETPTTQLWGVPLDTSANDPRLDVILVKFARARQFDLDAAADQLRQTLIWRRNFRADEILNEEFPDYFNGVGFLHGKDKDGRPVTYNRYGNMDEKKVFGNLDTFLRWRVQLMERGVRAIDFVNIDSMIQVHDYDGVSLLSFFGRSKQSKEATSQVIKLMQDNYPEFLHKKYFIRFPKWAALVFNWLSSLNLISEETRRKFIMCAAGDPKERQLLLDQVPEEELPTLYGGKGVVPELEKGAKDKKPEQEQPRTVSKPEELPVQAKATEESRPDAAIESNPSAEKGEEPAVSEAKPAAAEATADK
ncbi:uncharacterized protein VTP21DRAFT_9724 [Calcarisporiella thermophila]|uniref:uncharacterized protein n=1 Tax=Calcarisporiella thermophila TaxID=911321 RepID=UPI003743AA58